MANWTPEEDQILLARVPQFSFAQIGAELGRTRNSCISRYHRLMPPTQRPMNPNTRKAELGVKAIVNVGALQDRIKRTRPKPRNKDHNVPISPEAPKPVFSSEEHSLKNLFDLKPGECKFPFDVQSPSGLTFLFCAKPQVERSSYCSDHHHCGVRASR